MVIIMNTEKESNKKVGMLSLVASGMFCNSEGKISVVKCLVVAVVIAAVAIIPHILISLVAMVVGGIILYWIASGLARHPAVEDMMTNFSNKVTKVQEKAATKEQVNANTTTA